MGLLFMCVALRSPALGAALLAAFVLIVSATLLIGFSSLTRRRVILTAVVALAAAAAFCSSYIHFGAYSRREFPDRVYTVNGRIDAAEEYGDGVRLILSDVRFKNSDYGTRYKIALYVYGEGEFDVGNRITFSSELEKLGLFYENRIAVTNVINGVKYTAFLPRESMFYLEEGGKNLFEKSAAFIENTLRAGMGEKEFSVAYALLTGEEGYMDGDVLENFRSGGVAHIFAVSGLHIGFLCTALFFVLKKIPIPSAVKSVLIVLCCLFYAGICGFTPSAIRAVVMCGVALFARGAGLKYDPLSSLAFAALCVCIVSPLQFYTVGFRLSFAAVFALCLLAKPVASALKFLPKKLASAVGVALAAQLGSMPVCLYYFGTVAVLAVAVNLVAIPLISVLFVSLIVGVAVGGVFSVPVPALFLQKYLVRFIVEAIMLVDYSKLAVACVWMGAGLSALYFAFLIFSAGMVNLQKIARRAVCFCLAGVLICGTCIVSVREFRATEIAVVSERNFSAVCLHSKGESMIVVCRADGYFTAKGVNRFLSGRGNKDTALLFVDENTDIVAAVLRLNALLSVDCAYYVSGESEVDLNAALSKPEGFFRRLEGSLPFGSGTLRAADGSATYFAGKCSALFASAAQDCAGYAYDLLVAPSFSDVCKEAAGTAVAFAPSTAGNLSYKMYESRIKRI